MISVAVMAHRKREGFVAELVEALDCDPVVVWDRHNDRRETGRRALLSYDPDATHHLVIQDDAIPCEDLVAGLTQAIAHTGEHPIGLYFGATAPNRVTNTLIAAAATSDGAAWIKMPGPVWGVGIVLPTHHIEEMVAYTDERRALKNYDTPIWRWYENKRGLDCMYTWPSLVDHRDAGESPSLVPGRTSRGRVAYEFLGADRSALTVDWTAGVFEVDGVTLISKGAPMFTFRNTNTGDVVTMEPDDPRVNRLVRMTKLDPPRWELIDSDEATKSRVETPEEPKAAEEPTLDPSTSFQVDLSDSIPEILKGVGDDQDLAADVLEAELSSDKPRKGLVKSLGKIVPSD